MNGVALDQTQSLLGFGAGGHAKVVLDMLRSRQREVRGLLDPDAGLWGKRVAGVEVKGGDDQIELARQAGVKEAFVGVGSVGDSSLRKRIFQAAQTAGLMLPSIVHARASVADAVELASGVQVMNGVIINPGVRIGENSIVNTGALVEHDCVIGAHSHISPGAVLGGQVTVGSESHIGIGAVVRQGVRIAGQVVIGAGAVVVNDIAVCGIYVGVPAKPLNIRK